MRDEKRQKNKRQKSFKQLIIKILTYPAKTILETRRHMLVLQRRKTLSERIKQWYVHIEVEEDASTSMTQPLLFLVHGRHSPGIRTDLGHFFCHWTVAITTALPCYEGQTELFQVTAVKLSFWYHFLYIPPWTELDIMITEIREASVNFVQNVEGVLLIKQN